MTPPQTHQRYDDINQPPMQQRPGLSRQEDHQVAQSNYLKEAAVMSNCTDPTQRTSGVSITELETLARNLCIRIEPLDAPAEEGWGRYDHSRRVIHLLPDLAAAQRRCVLAELLAHVRLVDLRHRHDRDAAALQMAARMLITAEDWDAIGPVWDQCKEDDPGRIFRKFGILPGLVAAYEWTQEVWHPEGCVNWFALCGNGNDDDIHGFCPKTLNASDAAVSVPRMVVGSPGGKEPVKPSLTVEVHGALIYEDFASFEASPTEARELARFLLEQAEAVESMAWNSDEISDPDASVKTPELVGVGGGR